MKKVIDFIKSNMIIVKWTIWYFFTVWLILRFVFNFDMFSYRYWWKFFHATLHGFAGTVFGILIYAMIPLYIATTITVYRKKEIIIKIPFIDKAHEFITKIFTKAPATSADSKEQNTAEETQQESKETEFPDDLPSELRTPFIRAKQHMSFHGNISIYNKQQNKNETPSETPDTPSIPIPTDFDITDSIDNDTNDFTIPMFHDINFDEPSTTPTEQTLNNNTTKYFDEHGTEYETYKNFVATERFLIYEHNDNDFWIMDENSWFASGKQIDSPVSELIELAKQNGLIPVIYLESLNIMDIETTIKQFESVGIRVIKSLDELGI